jgi:hypothetical protein
MKYEIGVRESLQKPFQTENTDLIYGSAETTRIHLRPETSFVKSL